MGGDAVTQAVPRDLEETLICALGMAGGSAALLLVAPAARRVRLDYASLMVVAVGANS